MTPHYPGDEPYGPIAVAFMASFALIEAGLKLMATVGQEIGTIAALLAGAGTFLIGCTGVAREVREWRARIANQSKPNP